MEVLVDWSYFERRKKDVL